MPECLHDKRFKEVFGLPAVAKGCLACHAENQAVLIENLKAEAQRALMIRCGVLPSEPAQRPSLMV